MKIIIMTLFPDMVLNGLSESILGRAIKKGIISIEAVNIRDYTTDKHRHVDDYPYGGGAGMVMQAEPIHRCYLDICDRLGKKIPVVYMTPQGATFSAQKAKELATYEELVILCGHYEGVDERALELLEAIPISIGDYVLTGGELAAMVVVDAISRMVPGVLANDESGMDESFEAGLLEYPQYTRPEEYMNLKVPEVLLSGDHAKIATWRRYEAIKRTYDRRPDLLEDAYLSQKEKEFIKGHLEK